MEYYHSTTIEELRFRIKRNARKTYRPIVIEGRTIAKTWWGASWCDNLERYADFSNRIERGKRYVRGGAVIDLKIEEGIVKAKVQGSRKKPYDVKIRISRLSDEMWDKVKLHYANSIESLDDLLKGNFNEDMHVLFYDVLFPSPKEISLDCSCPDWALLCKHVAAALYGVGALLDSDPILFFLLRSINFEELIQMSIQEKTELMLQNIGVKTSRIIDDDEADSLFQL